MREYPSELVDIFLLLFSLRDTLKYYAPRLLAPAGSEASGTLPEGKGDAERRARPDNVAYPSQNEESLRGHICVIMGDCATSEA